jgi:putative restriction endonuclease
MRARLQSGTCREESHDSTAAESSLPYCSSNGMQGIQRWSYLVLIWPMQQAIKAAVANQNAGLALEYPRRVAALGDYLDLTAADAQGQFRMLVQRRPVQQGRQVTFLPVETLLCLAASFVVNHRHFGGGTAHQAPEPVPSLGRLFSRPPSSVLAKMANLDGSRSHGARWDALAGAILRDNPARFSQIYRLLLHSARGEGVGPERLPDFLGLEQGGELTLLSQGELDLSVLEESLRRQLERDAGRQDALSLLDTERILLAAARVGQHVFAQQVLANCGSRCVFCGLQPAAFGAKRMLLAGHIKPWKDSTPTERLDLRNGLAACPAHDVAFDTGLLAVNGGLRIHVARSLSDATVADPLARQYYGRPPLRETLLLPLGAQPPARKYLDWHRQKIFVA